MELGLAPDLERAGLALLARSERVVQEERDLRVLLGVAPFLALAEGDAAMSIMSCSSLNQNVTGITCGWPSGPTVAIRASVWLRMYSISLSVKPLTAHFPIQFRRTAGAIPKAKDMGVLPPAAPTPCKCLLQAHVHQHIILRMSTKHPTNQDDEEQEFLDAYDPRSFPPVAVTVDVALLTIRAGKLSVLLVSRAHPPFMGTWALPGGFVQSDEELDTAARRELLEETGLETFPGHLEQLSTYGAPNRDPRMRVVTVAYLGMMPDLPRPVAGSDAAGVRFWPVEDLDLAHGRAMKDGPVLAFDHHRIIAAGVERARSKLEYTPLATRFADEAFTLADLRRIYQAVWGTQLHPANFRRKVLSTPGFVEPIGAKGPANSPQGRAAELYRSGGATLLHPAMLRPDEGVITSRRRKPTRSARQLRKNTQKRKSLVSR